MAKRAKTEKVSVTIPTELAVEIRELASRGEVSAFFAEALGHYLAYRKQKKALETGFGAWKDGDHPELEGMDSATYVSKIREADSERLKRLGENSAG